MSQLSYARYGKDNIRLYKVKRNSDGTQDIVEMTVRILLEGEIETSYVSVFTSSYSPTC
jgi:urate oxidase